jgi:hypothetical protein
MKINLKKINNRLIGGVLIIIGTLHATGLLNGFTFTLSVWNAVSELPKKRSKKNPLTKDDKRENQRISSIRITIENIIWDVKIFRIIAEKYRNRRKCFAMRFQSDCCYL